jgi:hypothetical protein
MALNFSHGKIRALIPDNPLKICEIGGICGFNFGIYVSGANRDGSHKSQRACEFCIAYRNACGQPPDPL